MKMSCLALLLWMIAGSCMHDENFYCDLKNIGTLRITFQDASLEHHVTVIHPQGHTRVKTFAAGILTDTLHLSPGSYTVTNNSLSAGGVTGQTSDRSVAIERCREHHLQEPM